MKLGGVLRIHAGRLAEWADGEVEKEMLGAGGDR